MHLHCVYFTITDNMNKLIQYFGNNRDTNLLYALLYLALAKKYYWYEIKMVYRHNISGERLFDWTSQVGLKHQDTSLSKRKIKQIGQLWHKDKSIKKLLCNGRLDCQIVCFLGRFNNGLKID
mgnify:CR=1 FL=1